MVIKVYHKDGSKMYLNKLGALNVSKYEQRRTLMEEDVINLDFDISAKVPFALGDYVVIYNRTYTLNVLPKLTKISRKHFTYECQFEGAQYHLNRCLFLNVNTPSLITDGIPNFFTGEFSLTGNAEFMVNVICMNMYRYADRAGTSWSLGTSYSTDARTFDFSGESCLAVLQKVAQEFSLEFTVEQSGTDYFINLFPIGGAGSSTGITLKYGDQRALFELSRTNVDTSNIITSLQVLGAAKNLSASYRGFSPRLKIASNELSIIEDSDKITAYGYAEGMKIFDEIFPHREGTISAMGSIGTAYTEFFDSSMPFDLNASDASGTLYIIAGTTPKIHFNTGNLAGYEFDISTYDNASKKFRIITYTDERGQRFPDSEHSVFQPQTGDKYVILDIRLPEAYITQAEVDLLAAGNAEYARISQPQVKYDCKLSRAFIKAYFASASDLNYFYPGDGVQIIDADLGVDKSMRITAFTRDLLDRYTYDLQIDEFVRKKRRFIDINKSQKVDNGAMMFSIYSPTWRKRIAQSVIIQERIISQGEINIRYGYDIDLTPGVNTIEFLNPADWATDNYKLDVKIHSADKLMTYYYETPPVKYTWGFSIQIPADITDAQIDYDAIKGNPESESV